MVTSCYHVNFILIVICSRLICITLIDHYYNADLKYTIQWSVHCIYIDTNWLLLRIKKQRVWHTYHKRCSKDITFICFQSLQSSIGTIGSQRDTQLLETQKIVDHFRDAIHASNLSMHHRHIMMFYYMRIFIYFREEIAKTLYSSYDAAFRVCQPNMPIITKHKLLWRSPWWKSVEIYIYI